MFYYAPKSSRVPKKIVENISLPSKVYNSYNNSIFNWWSLHFSSGQTAKLISAWSMEFLKNLKLDKWK